MKDEKLKAPDKRLLTKEEPIPEEVRNAYVRFYDEFTYSGVLWKDYISLEGGKVVIRTFAGKNTKRYGMQILEVIRRIPGIEHYGARCLWYNYLGGWIPNFDPDQTYYGTYRDKQLRMEATVINEEILRTVPEFRYCGEIQGNTWVYLTRYLEHPEVELFGKMGLRPYASLLAKCKKDHQFRRWLFEHREECKYAGPAAAIRAYTDHCTVTEAQNRIYEEKRFIYELSDWASCHKWWDGVDTKRLKGYFDAKKVGLRSYKDYLSACRELNIPLTDNILYPSNFETAHDLRINQLNAKKVKDKEAMCENFTKICESYKPLETTFGPYCILIPVQVSDLVREGETLHHCVGKMGYDLKVTEGKSIIAFMRSTQAPDKPLYTIEYGVAAGKILQSHGDHNISLPEDAKQVVEQWAKQVKAQLKGG